MIDWESIERLYRLGAKTIRAIADEYGVDKSSISRRAKREGWTRDLSEQVRAATKAKVNAAIAEEAARDAYAQQTKRVQADVSAVEMTAQSNALLIAEHEKGAAKGRELMVAILKRIEAQIHATPEQIDAMVAALSEQAPDAVPMLLKAMSIGNLVDAAKKAIEGHAKAVEQERRARGLDDKGAGDDDNSNDALILQHLEDQKIRLTLDKSLI